MVLRDLSAKRGVREHPFNGFHHAVDVGAAFEEAEFRGECDFADDVEGEVLQPRAEVDGGVVGG